MSFFLPEVAVRSVSRQEMVQWAMENCGTALSRRLLQASVIPNALPSRPTTLHKLFESRTTPRYRRFSSTMPDKQVTITQSPTTPNTLRAILEKPSKSTLDIDALRSLLVDPSISSTVTPQDRYDVLLLLLKFKKPDWVYTILENDVRDDTEKIIYLEALSLLDKADEVTSLLQPLDIQTRDRFLRRAVHDLTETIGRSRIALHLWIRAAQIHHPSMKVVHQPNTRGLVAILLTILNKIKEPREIIQHSFEIIDSPIQRTGLLHNLSYAYYMLLRPSDIVKVWQATEPQLRTSSILSNTIQAYTSLKDYESALNIFFQNKPLWNDKMKGDLIAAVTGLRYKGKAFQMLQLQVREGIYDEYKMVRILETLLFYKRNKEFDIIAELYSSNPTTKKLSSNFYNTLMKRQSKSSDPSKFYEHLRSLYTEKQTPTSRTFRSLFEHFAQHGHIEDAMSLLEVLIQRKKKLTAHHFTSLIQTCESSKNVTQLTRIVKAMKKLQVEPNDNFQRALLSLHYSLKDYEEVQRLFSNLDAFKDDARSLILLMKSHLMRGQFQDARLVYHKIMRLKGRRYKHSDLYLAKLEYFTFQGKFLPALKIFNQMQHHGVTIEARHYRALMKGYNKFHKYEDAINLFRVAIGDGNHVDASLYREFIFSMVRTGVLNEANLSKPTLAVDEIFNRYRRDELPIRGKLNFKTIKPLVKTLIKRYDPQEAFRIMQEFTEVEDSFDINGNLNFMKQEMILFASQKNWNSFEIAFTNFQERVKEYLVEDGEAPLRLKKIYNSIIKVIYQHYLVKKDLRGFTEMFQDLIFVHMFTFDSNRMNWVTRMLLSRPSTIHHGLKLVESKLIGGRIAKSLVRNEKTAKRRLGEKVVRYSFKGRLLKPHLALGLITQHELNQTLYNHILNSSRKRKKDIRVVLNHYKNMYPKTMATMGNLNKRFKRRMNMKMTKMNTESSD